MNEENFRNNYFKKEESEVCQFLMMDIEYMIYTQKLSKIKIAIVMWYTKHILYSFKYQDNDNNKNSMYFLKILKYNCIKQRNNRM